MNFQNLIKSLFTLPATQQDVSQIASLARQVQSPEVQMRLNEMQSQLETALAVQGFMSVVQTAALIGIFVLLYKKR